MKANEIEQIELSLLLEAIFKRYGHDFRNYAKASVYRRVDRFREASGCESISDIIPKIMYDREVFETLLLELSITVTEMFRDPAMFASLRERVIPYLKSYPSVKVWHAGCATGQEAYSLAVLFEEEQMSQKSIIYATDFNDAALSLAKQGIYEIDKVKQYVENYKEAGGKYSLSEYYHAKYNAIQVTSDLKSKITFANHNLATDSIFSESHLIFCRNVLIYFDKELQKKVLKMFHDSLVNGGFLCLGTKESLLFSSVVDAFDVIDEKYKIYQKKIC